VKVVAVVLVAVPLARSAVGPAGPADPDFLRSDFPDPVVADLVVLCLDFRFDRLDSDPAVLVPLAATSALRLFPD